ncbi:MAG: glycoside hydrolase family 15 protein [Nitrospira sp.]|nr:glycoside hydrolase family 15 protein [Nitrospira sp.]
MKTETRTGCVSFQTAAGAVALFAAPAFLNGKDPGHAAFLLNEGEQAWAVLARGEVGGHWTDDNVTAVLNDTAAYWRRWARNIVYTGPRAGGVERCAMTVHLLSHAPTGSLVASPTSSLPERFGGDRNYDYRFAWVRDASLSLAIMAVLGDRQAAKRYMDWIVNLGSSTDAPLQVLYRLSGATDASESQRKDLAGYRGSRPVRFGNHAFQQRQHDSLGYFVDCAAIYSEQGGEWREDYWHLIQRIADYVIRTWETPDSGIWELGSEQHYVSSKVMSWVALDRAARIAERLGHVDRVSPWRAVMKTIHAEVMDRGWSQKLSAFRQRYEAETLDASVLLIPVMGFLPAHHPRVRNTVDRIAESLMRDGLVYRFDPQELPERAAFPLGKFEGAFLPCTLWLATAYAMAGRTREAEDLLQRVETTVGNLGLFPEEVAEETAMFLGNMPLVFAQVEYIRAVMELDKARPFGKLRLMAGKLLHAFRRTVDAKAEPLPG